MAKKVLLKDENSVEILPITRGELILDSSGKQALHSDEFLATTSQPGLMSKEDKNKIDNISISTLEITDLLTSGNKIATIKVGKTPYTIFAPESYDWSKIDNKPETIYNYGMVETLSNLNNANYWKFFQSTFQAENIAGSDLYNNWLSGITLGNDYITPYRVQFGLGYDGTAYSRYEKDHVWSSWKRLAFSNDKLSQFTDDVVAGKYLPLSGGTLTNSLTVQNAITVDMSAFGNAQVIFKTLNGTGFLLYVKEDDWRFANEDFSVHRKILHSGNFSNYALSKDGTAVAATKLATARTIWGQPFDGTENISGVISRATAIWGNKPEGGEYHNYRIIPYVNRLLFQIASYDGTSKNGVLELSGWESANLEKFSIFSSATTHNGTFTVGSLLTAKGISTGAAITLTGTDAASSTIAFSRTTYNYITSPAGGDIGLQPGGLTKNSATGYKFTVSEFRPGASNVYNLGLSEYRWKNVYATNFVGNTASLTSTITSSGFIKTESSNDYVLLGGGSHKAISDFVIKGDELNSNLTTITKTLTVSRDWVDTDIVIDSATFPDGDGSYIVQISRSSYYVFTGVVTLLPSQSGRVSVEDSDEIILHGGGFDATFQYYLRTKHDTTNKVVKLQMARNNMDDRSLTFTFKFKKLI